MYSKFLAATAMLVLAACQHSSYDSGSVSSGTGGGTTLITPVPSSAEALTETRYCHCWWENDQTYDQYRLTPVNGGESAVVEMIRHTEDESRDLGVLTLQREPNGSYEERTAIYTPDEMCMEIRARNDWGRPLNGINQCSTLSAGSFRDPHALHPLRAEIAAEN